MLRINNLEREVADKISEEQVRVIVSDKLDPLKADLTYLKDEFDFYLQNKDSFVAKYEGKFISIKNHLVICQADTREDAIANTIKIGNEMGKFLVQHVSKNDDETIQRFYSRVYC